MFEELPSETVALRTLIADLHDGLEERVGRLRLLMAMEYDFGAGRGLLLPGGTPAQFAYQEVRQAFVVGNFLSVVLLCQCVLENVLAAHLGLEALSVEIKGTEQRPLKERPQFSQTIAVGRAAGLLDEADEQDLLRLAGLRNALAHFRSVHDESHMDRRSISERRSPDALFEEDARFAMLVFLRVLAKPQFRFAMDTLVDVMTPRDRSR